MLKMSKLSNILRYTCRFRSIERDQMSVILLNSCIAHSLSDSKARSHVGISRINFCVSYT